MRAYFRGAATSRCGARARPLGLVVASLISLPVAGAGPINGIVPSVVVLLFWLPYRARVQTLSHERRAVPGWRQACYAAGLLTLAIALSAPVDSLADQLLVAHMAEHLVIGDISALLIVLVPVTSISPARTIVTFDGP